MRRSNIDIMMWKRPHFNRRKDNYSKLLHCSFSLSLQILLLLFVFTAEGAVSLLLPLLLLLFLLRLCHCALFFLQLSSCHQENLLSDQNALHIIIIASASCPYTIRIHKQFAPNSFHFTFHKTLYWYRFSFLFKLMGISLAPTDGGMVSPLCSTCPKFVVCTKSFFVCVWNR